MRTLAHQTRTNSRANTVILIGHDGESRIHERRFGPEGLFEGETVLVNQPLL